VAKLNTHRIVKNWEFGKLITPQLSGFRDNGFGRRFSVQSEAPYWKEAFECFRLIPSVVEPSYKNFIGNNYLDGAFVPKHQDNAPDGYVHTRCNLMIKKPMCGGNPVIDGEILDVDVGDLWLCLASLENHGTTPIQGGERIIFSFGALVSEDQVFKLLSIPN